MSYNDPKPKRGRGQPRKHRTSWNVRVTPAVRAGIEAAAASHGHKNASDFLNAHFSHLATPTTPQE